MPNSWLKGCEFESWQEQQENLFFRVNFVCWLLFGVYSIPVSPQWHVKDPGHSDKNAGGRLQLNTNTPLTQQSQSVTTVAHKRPRSFCQKFRWQVTAKHAYALDPMKSELADYGIVQA